MKSGAHLRFLLIGPSKSSIEMAGFRIGDAVERGSQQQNITDSLRRLAAIWRKAQDCSGSVEVRRVDYLAPWTVIGIDPASSDGFLSVRFTSFRTPDEDRPTIEIWRKKDEKWFGFFLNQFESVWEEGTAVDLSQHLMAESGDTGEKVT